MTAPDAMERDATPLQVEIAEQIARDASCAQGEFNQRVLSIIPYLTDVCDRASLVGVQHLPTEAQIAEAIAEHIEVSDATLKAAGGAACIDGIGDAAKAIHALIPAQAGRKCPECERTFSPPDNQCPICNCTLAALPHMGQPTITAEMLEAGGRAAYEATYVGKWEDVTGPAKRAERSLAYRVLSATLSVQHTGQPVEGEDLASRERSPDVPPIGQEGSR